MSPSSNKYWAFVASLATTLALAEQLAEDGDAIAVYARDTWLIPCGRTVQEASQELLQAKRTRMAGAVEVLSRLQK
jgi:hypothetical protein